MQVGYDSRGRPARSPRHGSKLSKRKDSPMKRLTLTLTLYLTLCIAPLSFLAGCSSSRPDGAAKRSVAAKTISPHLPFGNPSEAGSAANNQLVLRPQFAASWNASKRIANWVAWRLVASDIGDTQRSQFYADP